MHRHMNESLLVHSTTDYPTNNKLCFIILQKMYSTLLVSFVFTFCTSRSVETGHVYSARTSKFELAIVKSCVLRIRFMSFIG